MKAGIVLKAPDGRKFRVCPEAGCDSQGRPMVRLARMERNPWEHASLWRPLAEVEAWEIVP